MSVQCPYCEHSLSMKGAKPGKYTTKCPKCERKFAIAIPDDPDLPPFVKALQAERQRFVTAPAVDGPAVAETIPGPTLPAPDAASDVTVDLSRTVPDDEAVRPADRPPAPAPASASMVGLATSGILGGYQILKELGRGGMGAVYLARQLSLNRKVALKVMRPEWAKNATFVARFTREAYAAAQLAHHNVVQIYDFGEDRGTTYFSMEFVDGQSLAGLVRQKTRLDPEEAVGYVLQAARGLKYAHDQSMIHRDVKPENLLLNAQGVVKVADLGLVKTPEIAEVEEKAASLAAAGGGPAATGASASDWASAAGSSAITLANTAMGTPAFMAPEQARDAAHVDHRADIYSLGCTLYDLVTGRPPFEGRTAIEVLTKVQTEPIPPPETVVKRVPKELSAIILKMTAKKPEERYRDLGEVIRSLEGFLGVTSTGPFTPREEHANLLEESVRAFNASQAARVRSKVVPAFLALCTLFAVFCLLTRKPVSAGAFLGLGLMTVFADFVIGGVRRRTALFQKARELVVSTPFNEWLMVLAGAVVVLAALWVFKLFWVWVVLGLVAVGVAAGLHATLDRKAEAERAAPLEQTEAMLRSMRLQGLEEDSLRQFVCKYSGDRWEEFYEALFGYEAKLEARERWGRGDRAKARPKFAVWRDPIAAWIDAKVKARREEKERVKIQKIEEAGLVAQGENLLTARRKSRRAAEAMVALAADIKASVNRPDQAIAVNRSIARSLREAAVKPENVLVNRESGLVDEDRRFRPLDLLNWVIGPKPRFLVGAALLAGCLVWMHHNEMLNAEQASAVVAAAKKGAEAVQKGDTDALTAEAKALAARAAKDAKAARARGAGRVKTLQHPMLPSPLGALVSSFGAGAGGLILIASSFFRGWKMALFAIPAAAVPVLGPKLGLPAVGSLDPSFAPAVVGAAIFVAGVLFGRERR